MTLSQFDNCLKIAIDLFSAFDFYVKIFLCSRSFMEKYTSTSQLSSWINVDSMHFYEWEWYWLLKWRKLCCIPKNYFIQVPKNVFVLLINAMLIIYAILKKLMNKYLKPVLHIFEYNFYL